MTDYGLLPLFPKFVKPLWGTYTVEVVASLNEPLEC